MAVILQKYTGMPYYLPAGAENTETAAVSGMCSQKRLFFQYGFLFMKNSSQDTD